MWVAIGDGTQHAGEGSEPPGLRIASMNVQALNTKVDQTFQLLTDRNLDILALQEMFGA